MNKVQIILATALLLSAPQAGAQDVSEGTVLAFDRQAKILVLKDKTTFPLATLSSELPDGLKAGDRVEIKYDLNEDDGVTEIHSIKILSQ